jgi:hypothetical protein
MPDISMCNNQNCASRMKCYRFLAKPCEFLQSYIVLEVQLDKCELFWQATPSEIGQYKKRKEKEAKRVNG